jgi:hypothetical protein
VDDAGSGDVTDATQVRTVVKERIHQGPRVVARRRVYDHVGRLDDDQQIFVFIMDVEGDVFRLGLGGFRPRNLNFDTLACMQVPRGAHRPPADTDESFFAPSFRLRATRSFDVFRDGPVDSDVVFFGFYTPTQYPAR